MSSHSGIKLDRAIEISPRCREVAEKELRETPERTREALERLKELLKENKDLVYGDDEESLTIFLRPCKWYPESAIQLMRRVAQFKVDHSNVLDGLMPDKEQEAFMNHRIANVLKDRDHKGRRILIVNCGGLWDPKKITVDQMFRVFYLIHVASMLETETQIMGSIIIMDFSNMGWSQAMAFTPSSSKRLLTFIQDAMPMRLKEVHFINQPMVFNVVWNMFKPFIREKLRNRIFFHGSKMPSLHKHIPTSHLPQDYGGALPPVDYSSADWFPVLKDCEQFIQTYGNYGFAKKT